MKKGIYVLLMMMMLISAFGFVCAEILDPVLENELYDGSEEYDYYLANYSGENDVVEGSYVVELKGKTLIDEELMKRKGVEEEKKIFGLFSVKVDYEEEIKNEHEEAIDDLLGGGSGTPFFGLILNFFKGDFTGFAVSDSKESEIVVGNEFYNAFNGFVLNNVSVEDLERIEKSGYVKNVYPNIVIKATLMDSVEIIQNGILAGRMDEDGNNCVLSGKKCLTGEGVTIGILDTGIDYTHPDLGGCDEETFLSGNCERVVGGHDFINDDNNPMDDHGHGTHCAGIAAGKGVLNGVAPNATLYAYKVLGTNGGTWESVMAGIERSVDPNSDGNFSDHMDIISLSLGGICIFGYNEYCGPDDAVSRSIDRVTSLGVVAVIAAGNSGPFMNRIGTPGTARSAITVGATYKQDYPEQELHGVYPKKNDLCQFSSRGPVQWASGSINKPDILAPGSIICSSQYLNAWSAYECVDSEHTAISGTSMATPHVAGVAALVKEKYPDLEPNNLKELLMFTATDLGYEDYEQGDGLINVSEIFKQDFFLVGDLDFGIAKGDIIQKRIKIFNFGVEEMNIDLEFEEEINGVLLNVSERSFIVSPSGSHEMLFELDMRGVLDYGSYSRDVLISHSLGEFALPFLYEYGANLDIDYYNPTSDLTFYGEEATFEISVQNMGNMKSDSVMVSVYEVDFKCSFDEDSEEYCLGQDLTLIGNEELSLEVGEYKSLNISRVIDYGEGGLRTFFVYVNSSNDLGGARKIQMIDYRIKALGPDFGVVRSYGQEHRKFIYNVSKIFEVGVYNSGSEKAENINLSLYFMKEYCSNKERKINPYCDHINKTLYSSRIFSLEVGEEGVLEYNFTFSEANTSRYILFIGELEGDSDFENNGYWNNLYYMNRQVDLKGSLYASSTLYVNTTNNVRYRIENAFGGNSGSNSSWVDLYYVNETCDNSKNGDYYCFNKTMVHFNRTNFSIEKNGRIDLNFNFIPEKEGPYTIVGILNDTTERRHVDNIDYKNINAVNPKPNLFLNWYYNDGYIDEDVQVFINVYNWGKINAEGADLVLYYISGNVYCSPYSFRDDYCFNYDLIEIDSDVVSVPTGFGNLTSRVFNWTPEKEGVYTLVAFINHSEDPYAYDNLKMGHIKIKEGEAPDLDVGLSLRRADYSEDVEDAFSVSVFNKGRKKVKDLNYSLYFVEGYCSVFYYDENFCFDKDLTFISSESFDLKKDELKTFTNLSWPKQISGEYTVVTKVDYEGALTNDNNFAKVKVIAKADGVELALTSFSSSPYPPTYETSFVVFGKNLGRINEFPVVNFYVDGELVDSRGGLDSSSAGGGSGGGSSVVGPIEFFFEFYHTFESEGEHEVRFELVNENDVDESNNVLERKVVVPDEKEIVFYTNLSDQEGIEKELYFHDVISELYEENKISLKVLDVDPFLYSFDPSFVESGVEDIRVFFNSRLEEEYNFDSSLYHEINDSGKKYYVVSYEADAEIYNQTYLFRVKSEDLEWANLSLDQTDLVYCEDFDDFQKSCVSSWVDAPASYSVDQDSILFIKSKLDFPVEAFALEKFEGFDGNSTNLNDSYGVLENLTFERKSRGKIRVIDPVDSLSFEGKNLLRYIKFGSGRISVDTNKLYGLRDAFSELTFRNIKFKNPQVYRDSKLCLESDCEVLYDKDLNELKVLVEGFSEYSVVEGPHCGDGNRDSNENCGNCVADYGSCPATGSPSSSGGGGCRSRWVNCTWGPCEDYQQKWICEDERKCGSTVTMPQDTKYCTEISNCIDNDGDGYGVGVDCLGPDYDDSDSGVYEYPDLILEEEAPDDERLDEDPNFLILILGVVSCVLIIVLFFGRKKRIKRKGPVKNVVDLKKKEKAKKSEKILLDYMKVYGEDFTLKELRRELVGDGFTEKQINNAAKKLGIK